MLKWGFMWMWLIGSFPKNYQDCKEMGLVMVTKQGHVIKEAKFGSIPQRMSEDSVGHTSHLS